MKADLIQPSYLKPGDSVAIVAPSGVLNNRDKEIDLARKLMESWGLNVKIGRYVFEKAGHFAGTDAQRIADLQAAIDNKNIKAIWMARGGYGMVRVIDKLDYSGLKSNPKWIVGYSDITALHNDLHNKGLESIHAMMCTSMDANTGPIANSINSLKDALFGKDLYYKIKGSEYNKEGEASGQLIGGNLTLLHTMLGSRSSLDTEGKILFIEEIGEYAYHIDRMLMSLKRAGFFKNCKGLIVGQISNIRENTTPWGKTIEQLILDAFQDYEFPILFGFPAGHEDDNRALILGREVNLKVSKTGGELIFFQ